MRQFESELQKLVYDEYGDELDKKDQEIKEKDQEIKEYKNKAKQLNQIENLNSPEARKIIQSMLLL